MLRIIVTQTIVTKLSEILVGDPGSKTRDPRYETRDPEKTLYRIRIGSEKHRIADTNPQHCVHENYGSNVELRAFEGPIIFFCWVRDGTKSESEIKIPDTQHRKKHHDKTEMYRFEID